MYDQRKINLAIIILGLCLMGRFAFADDNLKTARLAGSWYPASAGELQAVLDKALEKAGAADDDKNIGVIISPHAGYVYSAPVAAYGFKAVKNSNISTVIVLAPSHHFSFEGASVWSEGAFETPLGRVRVDHDLAARIMAFDKRFVFRKDIFEGIAGRPENSVETQIPFIQRIFPLAKIVPIIMGYPPDPAVMRSMAEALSAAIGGRSDVLVDVSVDQSHFHSDSEARVIDARGLKAILDMDLEALGSGHRDGSMEVDGFHVVMTAMLYAKKQGYDQAKVLQYATSGDVTGDKNSVVGYASVVLYKKQVAAVQGSLGSDQRSTLLEIARNTVEAFVKTGKVLEVVSNDTRLQAKEGAFVTLHKNGQLRGCIGNIIGERPLYQTIRDMAVAAASQDPRFPSVREEELKDIDIEISVLSVPQVAKSADEIEMGRHGVIVSRGYLNRGVFLPQVATETGWSKEKFLSELCSQKAGLAPDAWRDPQTRLEIFSAEVFGEKK